MRTRWTQSKVKCTRCGRFAWVRQTVTPTEHQLNEAYYYRRTYFCRNSNCRRKVFFFDEDRVWNRRDLTAVQIEHDAQRRIHERKIGNYARSVRPNPNVPIGWPSDGRKPPWEE
jgi:hypothetical protein